MTQLTEHAKSILRAIADGKQIEYKRFDTHWVINDSMVHLGDLLDNGRADSLRIAPETRSINGRVFVAPGNGGAELIVTHGTGLKKVFGFLATTERDAAYNAIIDALEGRTK